jgi:hypothetical protein
MKIKALNLARKPIKNMIKWVKVYDEYSKTYVLVAQKMN